MLDAHFISTNLHFGINILAALVSFAVFWLIFDAWTVRHEFKELIKWLGFLALSLGFLLRATATQAGAGDLLQYIAAASDVLRGLGYLGIIIGQFVDPLQPKPAYRSDGNLSTSPASAPAPAPVSKPVRKPRHHALGPITLGSAGFALPLLPFLAGILYLRRATTGLERHLAPVAWGFAGLTIFEILSQLLRLPTSVNPNLDRLLAPLGPIWWSSLAVLAIASLIMGAWVWHYLVKRLESQLFIILIAQTLILFLVSTVGFTFLLFQNIQKQSLADLTTASHVLDYAVTSRQAETAAQAEAVASSGSAIAATAAHDHVALRAALGEYLARHGLSSLTITDTSGAVLLRGEDPDRWGDSRSSDPLVRRGLIGEAGASVVIQGGVVAPAVSLVAGAPIRDASGAIIGTAIAGRAISNAFVDGIRTSTGLDSTVYGRDIRAATTIAGSGGHDRAIGVKETSTAVTDQVLTHGKTYTGVVTLQNRAYLAAFTPLRNINNVPVGMLLVAHPQDELYATANRSIQLTFVFVVVLIVLSVYPVYLVSRFLANQLK